MTEPLARLPGSITAGMSLSWKVSQDDYAPSAGWVLRYVILSASAQSLINPSAGGGIGTVTDNGDGTWTVALTPSETTTLADGAKHRFVGYVANTSTGEEIVVDETVVLVKADPKTATTGLDPRSDDEIVLDAITATIKGTATVDQSAISIAGRSLTRRSLEELLALEKVYRERVAIQRDEDRIRKGLTSGRRVLCRMGTPS